MINYHAYIKFNMDLSIYLQLVGLIKYPMPYRYNFCVNDVKRYIQRYKI